MIVDIRHATMFILAGSLILVLNLWAADDDIVHSVPASYEQRFDDKIDAWFDGTVTSVDTDNGTFVVRGSKKPYATAYAQMLNDIHAKTSKLEGVSRQDKEFEIRKAWREKLNASQKELSDEYSSLTFKLPAKASTMSLLDESRFYGRPFTTQNTDKKTVARNTQTGTIGLKDLRSDEHVIIGYDSGVTGNNAYVAIRARYEDYPMSEEYTGGKNVGASDNSRVNARDADGAPTADQQGQGKRDIEITQQIRRAVVKDESLSTYAHNIKIITENGAVTLKGPVRTETEKQVIEKMAVVAAGAGRVSNQIEIAP